MKTIAKLLSAVLVLAFATHLRAEQFHDWHMPTDTAITYGHLPNGMAYYIIPCDRPAYKINFYLMLNIGSSVEEPSQYGMAHFIEHMAFNGSKHFPGRSMFDYLESHGLEWGYDFNATTGPDYTCYRITDIDSRHGQGLIDSCLLILRDFSTDLTLAKADVEKERPIILEEWRSGNDVWGRTRQGLDSIAHGPDSPYSHAIVGTPQTLASFTAADLRKFYEKWYQPQHQAIMVIGDINPQELEQKIMSTWSDVRAPKHPSKRPWWQTPNHEGIRGGFLADPETSAPMMFAFFKCDLPDRENRDLASYINDNYLAMVLTTALNQRLEEIATEYDCPWQMAAVDYDQYLNSDSKDAICVIALYAPERRWDMLGRFATEMKRMATHGITEGELSSVLSGFETIADRMATIADERNNSETYDHYSQHFYKGNVVLSAADDEASMRCFLDTVTATSINRYAAAHLQPTNLTVMLIENGTPAQMPADSEISSRLLAAWEAAEVEQIAESDAHLRPLIDFEITPGTVESWKYDDDFPARHYVLSNGARLTICYRAVVSDEVQLLAICPGGDAWAMADDVANGYYATALAELGGLGSFSPTDLNRKFMGKGISLSANQYSFTEQIAGKSRVEDLETLLQMAYLRLTDVRADTTAFLNWKSNTRQSLLDKENSPESIFNRRCNRNQYGSNPLMAQADTAMIEAIDYGRALDIFRSQIANPAAFEFILVGPFIDDEAVLELCLKYIGGLPSGDGAPKPVLTDRLMLEGEHYDRFTLPMPSPYTRVSLTYEAAAPYSLSRAMTLDVLESVLDKMCLQSLREEMGGTYTPTITTLADEYDGTFELEIEFDTNAEAADGMIEAARQALRDLADNGPDQALFEASRDYLADSYRQASRQQSYPMKHFSQMAKHGNSDVLMRTAAISSVTPYDVQQMARMLLNARAKFTIVMDGVQAE